MAEFESYPDDYKPYPLREFLVSDQFGNHAFFFRFYPAKIYVCSEDNMDNLIANVYCDYKTSLGIEISSETYPAIWELLQSLLQLDLETSFFNATAQKMFKAILSIKGIEAHFFPKQILDKKTGYINWNRYNIYERFQNKEEGFDLTTMTDQAITKKDFPLHHWYLMIVFSSELYTQAEITKDNFENLIGKNEPLVLEYVDLFKFKHSKFYTTQDQEGELTYTLCTMTVYDEPVLFFIVNDSGSQGEPL